MDTALPKITSKNSKDEILKAYTELLNRREIVQSGVTEKKAEITKAVETAIVEKASEYTVETIIKGLADLNVNMGNALTALASQLNTEARKLSDIRQAILIESARLHEVYDIDVAANTLDILIQEHHEKQAAFDAKYKDSIAQLENEMLQKRNEWKKEQETYLAMIKETEAKHKKEREREKEEYDYSTALARKKDHDAYLENKSLLEKELRELRQKVEEQLAIREAAVAAQEQELIELKTKTAAFPTELSSALKKMEADTIARIEIQMTHAETIRIKEFETEKRLADLKISSLEEMLAKQHFQIESLTKKLEESSNQVQAIAVKAIEGASNTRALSTLNDIAMEQAKNMSR
jgi:hypothetical protein